MGSFCIRDNNEFRVNILQYKAVGDCEHFARGRISRLPRTPFRSCKRSSAFNDRGLEIMADSAGAGGGGERVQHVLVMRHGDRIDQFEPLWALHAERPWDPPLTEEGKIRAWTTGKRLRGLGFPIHRVLVSPFLRCLQTAAEAVSALCAVVPDDTALLSMETSRDAVLDPSRLKVSIEYGLCEVLCRQAISPDLVPKDGNWIPDVSELESILPEGTIDRSVEGIYQELPRWEEPMNTARKRYEAIIQALADKFPHENLLLVTHGEGVGVAVSSFLKDVVVFEVEYCAFSHMQRKVSFESSGSVSTGNFMVQTATGQSGICYYASK